MSTIQNMFALNRFSMPKSFIGFIIILAVSFPLSYLYGIFCSAIPMIYLTFIFTVFFGTALAYISIFAHYISKQIHKSSQLIITGISGLISWYFSWVAYILYINKDQFESVSEAYFSNFVLIFQPSEVFRIIGEINVYGLWKIDEVTVNGSPLTMIWILEALLIIGLPVILVYKQHQKPFSEKQNTWYREFVLEKDFGSVFGKTHFKEDLLLNPIATIESLDFGRGNQYTQISIFYLPQEDIQFLSLFDIRIDKEDKKEKNEIVHLLEISTQDAEALMDIWKAKKSLVPFL